MTAGEVNKGEDDEDKGKDEGKGSKDEDKMFECRMCNEDSDAEEGRIARPAMTPYQPSKREVDDHELTHMPYRNWCVHCNKGKAKNAPHTRGIQDDDDPNRKPIISIDYMYMEADYKDKKKEQYIKDVEGKTPILVVVDSKTKAVFAHDMEEKGANEATMEQLENDIKELGYHGSDIIIKGDQEPSIVAIQELIARRRSAGNTVLENSPVGESSSNGRVERAIQSVQGQIRTIKDNVEAKTGRKIPRKSGLFQWLVEWAAATITRYRVNSDGKTSYATIKGRQSQAQVAGFGEKVLYMPLKSSKVGRSKLEVKMEDGVFVGIRMRSDEIMMATERGTVKARSIKRRCVEERWDAEFVDKLKGSPGQPVPGIRGSHIPINIKEDGVKASEGVEDHDEHGEEEEDPVPKEVNRPRAEETKVRQMRVRREDLEKFGFTPGCPGCRTVSTPGATGNTAHNDECRERIKKKMSEDEEGRERLARDKERVERRSEEIIEQESMKVEEIREAQRKHDEEIEAIRHGKKDNKDEDMSEKQDENIPSGGLIFKTPKCILRGDTGLPADEARPAQAHAEMDSDTESRCPRDSDDEMIIKEEVLEAAPGSSTDVRIEIPRAPASKRSKEGDEDERPKKWQQYEFELDAITFGADVAEVYSPERVVKMAKEFGLKAGFSLDLTNTDGEGTPWDFSKVERRNAAIRKVIEEKPLFVIGSPMCDQWSIMQNANKHKWSQEERTQRLEAARIHLEFMCEVYKIQAKNKRYYVHEHPATAASWQEKCVIETQRSTKGVMVMADMCRFGMVTHGPGGTGLAMKPTRFLTNSIMVAKQLERKCLNKILGIKDHEHIALEGSRTKQGQVYPAELCRAICRGIRDQKEFDKCNLVSLLEVGPGQGGAMIHMLMQILPVPPCEEDEEKLMAAWDDVTGEELDPEEVEKARAEEVQFYKSRKVYTKVPKSQCWKRTGKAPIPVRWIDHNKGDKTRPNYRSRLVAKDIKKDARPDLYAATPPLEALKTILALAAKGKKGTGIMVNDVKRAYFYAPATREIYVELCEEDREPGDEEMCGILNYSMYGTRDAAQNWQIEFTSTLLQMGFNQGKSSPCVFHHRQRNLRTFVHGDDYVTAGDKRDLRWMEDELGKRYEIKTTVIGGEEGDERRVRVLNRLITWVPGTGVQYEADPRHAQVLIKELLEGKKKRPVVTPGMKEEHEDTKRREEGITKVKKEGNGKKNEEEDEVEGTRYRGLAARANFLAADRVDIQYAVKEACRRMSRPTRKDWEKLTRIAQYLLGKPRMVINFPCEGTSDEITVSTDTDWAGCRRTRRSTTGGCVEYGGALIKSWSTTQATIALSSGEAELYGIVKGSAEGLGMQSLLRDLGVDVNLRVKADASAALGVVNRVGLGKLRHLHTNWLWVQEKAMKKEIQYHKTPGSENTSDILTKAVESEILERHCKAMKVEFPVEANSEGYMVNSIKKTGQEEDEGDEGTRVTRKTCKAYEGKVWTRQDLGTYCLRGTNKNGPKWTDVVARVTIDEESRKVLRVESKKDMDSQVSYHKQWREPKDTTTALIYRTKEKAGVRTRSGFSSFSG